MINHTALATLAIETFRASGARTPERLQSLVRSFATSYFGPSSQWHVDIIEMVARAQADAHRRVPDYMWAR